MGKKKILYVASNDGSDTRINKEIKTLAKIFDVIFLGLGESNANSFIREYCYSFVLIIGNRKSPLVMLKHILKAFHLLLIHKIHSVHIINEQLYVPFIPIIFFKNVVLDLFDSIFLTLNKPGEQWSFIKRMVYLPANKIIVTDLNRKNLLPKFLLKSRKAIVLDNYPNYYNIDKPKISDDYLVIIYSGTLMERRGSKILLDMVKTDSKVKIICAGWVQDNITRELLEQRNVEYLGIVPQEEVLKQTVEKCHYVLSLYEPVHLQNINASPNKIYDGIMCSTPVIINSEVKVSEFVKRNKIGIVIDDFYKINTTELINELRTKYNNFTFPNELKTKCSWESIENKLVQAHA